MYISKNGKEFITIETNKNDAIFLFNCIASGVMNIPIPNEDVTRHKNFINQLQDILNNSDKNYSDK